MVTLHLTVLTSRRNSAGKLPVLIALTSKRQVRYIKTGYEIDDLFQFEDGEVVCRKDARIMNQRLNFVLSEYRDRLRYDFYAFVKSPSLKSVPLWGNIRFQRG